MKNEGLKIDEERGTVSGYGEELKLAREIRKDDKGRFYVYADELKGGCEYDIVVINERGEVAVVWRGEYAPYMFAFKLSFVWAAGHRILRSSKISEKMVKKRGVLGDDKR